MCKGGGAKMMAQRWWSGGVAAFYVGLLLDGISKTGTLPNMG